MKKAESFKDRIEKLVNKSIFFNKKSSNYFHHLVLIDAVKSLVSLDFDNSKNNEIISWLESAFPINIKNNKKHLEIKVSNASFKELKEVLINKEKNKIDNILVNFNMLTEGTQLLEFFLEMSLYQSGKSFINIWRSLKIFKFIKVKDKVSFYKLMSTFIFDDNFREDFCFDDKDSLTINMISDNQNDIIFYANLIDCMNSEFIRKKDIDNALASMLFYFRKTVNLDSPIEVYYDQKKKDRVSILSLINDKKIDINYNNILLLDSSRILIKNNQYISESFLNNIYNKLK